MAIQSRDFALVVGLNHYPYFRGGRDLQGAIDDARHIADWLKDVETGGGLPPENCKLILSTSDPLAPDVGPIERDLADIGKRAQDMGGGRRFYLFFSGHGHSFDAIEEQLPDVALCLPLWSRELPNKSISANHLRGWVQRCMPFEEIIIFLDCCRSRELKSRAQNTAGGCAIPRQGFDDTKIVSIFAAEHEEMAFESSGKDDVDARGYFTTALLAGLKGGAAGQHGGVTHTALWDYLQAEVPRLAQKDGRMQIPKLGMQLPVDKIVFGSAVTGGCVAGPAAGQQWLEIRFNDWRNGPIRLLDAGNNIVRQDLASTGPWPVTLKHELHLIEELQTGDRMSFTFRPGMEGKHVSF
ncbi:peptidase C14 caspase family protein (plasmid) [Rhizobium gallicum]|uniref:Peptidase C14 caspase family protein n=1 Tax=Rhizobium gallicum TaxID=56730 RepID=A0A1L5NWH1_9HYPH|nr:caspase family protein [Rhizobium gallicum]APO72221.1 peptidase C14 caspase family protein [Rhizobium gallicum]